MSVPQNVASRSSYTHPTTGLEINLFNGTTLRLFICPFASLLELGGGGGNVCTCVCNQTENSRSHTTSSPHVSRFQHTEPTFVLFLLLGNTQVTTGRKERGANMTKKHFSHFVQLAHLNTLVTYQTVTQELPLLIQGLWCSFLLAVGWFEKTIVSVSIYASGQLQGETENANVLT